MKYVKTAVVILNWNGLQYLKKFLSTVVRYSKSESTYVYVADNGSTDDSVEYIKNSFNDVKIIEFDKNYGFAGGYNKALMQIKADYYVLLNSDIEVSENWIEPIVSYMDNNLDVATCMPKIISYYDKERFEYAGAAGGFIDKYGYPFCKGRIINHFEKDKGQYNEVDDIFWATGACMFIRSDVFENLGGFDDDLFAHMEEIDLCWRIKNRGYKIKYIPDSKVFHVGGGTLPNNNPFKIFLNYRNSLLVLYKNLPSSKLISILFARMILDGFSAIVFVLSLRFSFFLMVIKAHISFYLLLPKYIQKRKLLKKYNSTKHKQIYNKSIIFDFFIRNKKEFKELKF